MFKFSSIYKSNEKCMNWTQKNRKCYYNLYNVFFSFAFALLYLLYGDKFQTGRRQWTNWNGWTYLGAATWSGNWSTHRCRNIPSHSWTPTIPNMKNTKKHSSNTLPNMGRVSSSSITSIRIPLMWMRCCCCCWRDGVGFVATYRCVVNEKRARRNKKVAQNCTAAKKIK